MSYPAVDFDSVHWVEPAPVRRPCAIRISLAIAAIVCALSGGAVINAWSHIPDIDLNGTGHSPAYDQPTLEASDEAPLLASVPVSPYGNDGYTPAVLPANYVSAYAPPAAIPMKAETTMTQADLQTLADSGDHTEALTVKAEDAADSEDDITLNTTPNTVSDTVQPQN